MAVVSAVDLGPRWAVDLDRPTAEAPGPLAVPSAVQVAAAALAAASEVDPLAVAPVAVVPSVVAGASEAAPLVEAQAVAAEDSAAVAADKQKEKHDSQEQCH